MPKLQKNKKLKNPVDNCMSPTARASAVDCYFSTYTFSSFHGRILFAKNGKFHVKTEVKKKHHPTTNHFVIISQNARRSFVRVVTKLVQNAAASMMTSR